MQVEAKDLDIDWVATHEIVACLVGGGGDIRIPDTFAEEARNAVRALRKAGKMTYHQVLALLLHELLQRDVMIGKLAQALGAPSPFAEDPPAPPSSEDSRLIVPDQRLMVVR